MASLISSIDDLDKINHYIANCKEMGIDRLPPDVNKSEDTFTVEITVFVLDCRRLKMSVVR